MFKTLIIKSCSLPNTFCLRQAEIPKIPRRYIPHASLVLRSNEYLEAIGVLCRKLEPINLLES